MDNVDGETIEECTYLYKNKYGNWRPHRDRNRRENYKGQHKGQKMRELYTSNSDS